MNKNIIVISGLVLLVICGIVLFNFLVPHKNSPNSSNTAAANASPNTVNISDSAFVPSGMKVKVNTTVKWVNKDSVEHSVVFSDGTKSDLLNQGDKYQRTFNKPGTYSYRCGIHSFMQGSILVE